MSSSDLQLDWRLRRKQPWWINATDRKLAPTDDRPRFWLWSYMAAVGHAVHRHPAMCCVSRPSFHGQFGPIPGMAQPPLAAKYYNPDNYRFDANGEIEILTPGETLDEKMDAHAEFMAQQIANLFFACNLFRGLGGYNDGAYDGACTLGEIGTTQFLNAEAYRRFCPLMQDMRDASPRSATVKTAPGVTRTITLPKRDINGQPTRAGVTAEDLAAIEAETDGVRHTGAWSMRSDYGRDRVYQMTARIMARLKPKLDAFVVPSGFSGAGRTVQLVYPKFFPLSLENYGYVLVGSVGRSIPADVTPPTTAAAFVEQVGNFWNERGDADVPGSSATIFRRLSDGRLMTLREALRADPVLGAPTVGETDFLTAYAPDLNTNRSLSLRQNYAFRRLEAHAQNWAIWDSIGRAVREVFPEAVITNFDHVCVKNPLVPYRRVGGGIESAQTQSWFQVQAPTLYPRNTGPGVDAIKNGVAGAVAQFDWDNLDEATGVCDTLRTDIPMVPFIHGIELESNIVSGDKTEWGGTPAFLKALLRDQWLNFGCSEYSVYSGDLDATFAALCDASESLNAG